MGDRLVVFKSFLHNKTSKICSLVVLYPILGKNSNLFHPLLPLPCVLHILLREKKNSTARRVLFKSLIARIILSQRKYTQTR